MSQINVACDTCFVSLSLCDFSALHRHSGMHGGWKSFLFRVWGETLQQDIKVPCSSTTAKQVMIPSKS